MILTAMPGPLSPWNHLSSASAILAEDRLEVGSRPRSRRRSAAAGPPSGEPGESEGV